MTKETQVFSFLGKRTYLHGTTLFHYLTQNLKAAEQIIFRCRKILTTDCVEISWGEGDMPPESGYYASLCWEQKGARCWAGVLPCPPSLEVRREMYDEEAICRYTEKGQNALVLSRNPQCGFVYALVAMNKRLLSEQQDTSSSGQWLFTGLHLNRFPSNWLPLKLEILRVMPGIAARSRVVAGTECEGMIEFVWNKENLHTAKI